MTKTEIIQEIAYKNDCTQKLANSIVDSFLGLIGDELTNGESVTIMGFGKFSASLVKGREGKNPQDPNGAPLVIPDTMRIYFSAGRKLKEQVNAPLREKQKKSSKKSK